jgi:hypothetical protein
MLSWSAQETGRPVDIGRIVTDGDVGIEGGRELVAIGRASIGPEPDPEPVAAAARVLGEASALYAAGVAANFEMMNRAVDAVGLPVGGASRSRLAHVIEALEMASFPHAGV